MSFYVELTTKISSEFAENLAEKIYFEILEYAAIANFFIETLDDSNWPNVTFKIVGENAFNCLHPVLVDLKPLESEPVSFAMYQEIEPTLFSINESELVVEYFVRDKQNPPCTMVAHTDSNARLVHISTGTTVQCFDRSRFRSYNNALAMLRSKIFAENNNLGVLNT